MEQDIDSADLEDLKGSIKADMASLEDLYADGPKTSDVAKEANAWKEASKPAEAKDEPKDDVSQETTPPAQKAKPKARDDDEDDDEPSDVHGLMAALKATRQKARERAERLKEVEERLASEARRAAEADHVARQIYAAQQQPQNKQEPLPPPPDPLIDPQGALEYRDRVWAEVIRQRDAALQQQREETNQQLYMSRLVPSQRMMRQQFKDYEEMEVLFAEAANSDPRLWAEIKRHEFPAEYAYQVGKQIKQAREIQTAGGWESWLEAKVNEKLAAIQPPPAPSVPSIQAAPIPSAPKAPPPQSLARVPSVTPRTARQYNGPTPISDLYK